MIGSTDFEILGMSPEGYLKDFCTNLNSFFRISSKDLIFDHVMANDKYEYSPKGLFPIFSRSNPRGFRNNLVKKQQAIFFVVPLEVIPRGLPLKTRILVLINST